jgi:hypothetical protein
MPLPRFTAEASLAASALTFVTLKSPPLGWSTAKHTAALMRVRAVSFAGTVLPVAMAGGLAGAVVVSRAPAPTGKPCAVRTAVWAWSVPVTISPLITGTADAAATCAAGASSARMADVSAHLGLSIVTARAPACWMIRTTVVHVDSSVLLETSATGDGAIQ